MYQQRITQMMDGMEKVVASFTDNLKTLRTGRASATLVEDLLVPYYGTPTPLKHIASITTPDPKQIVISPWDKSALSEIETAVKLSDLGFSPTNDGNVVRLAISPLTEERRKELAKKLNLLAEEAKVALRTLRRDVWDEIQDMEKESRISEDDRYAAEKELNKAIDDFQAKIDERTTEKEKEIMTI
jgi:ribosome recycling factor